MRAYLPSMEVLGGMQLPSQRFVTPLGEDDRRTTSEIDEPISVLGVILDMSSNDVEEFQNIRTTSDDLAPRLYTLSH
jgi:hypothetical protein